MKTSPLQKPQNEQQEVLFSSRWVDGIRIFLWHDHWHADEALYPKYGYRIIYDADSSFQEKLDFVLKNIHSQLCSLELKDEDKAKWLASASGKFSCAVAFEEIRDKSQVVKQWNLVWLNLSIPKHAFIGWLALNNKLLTKYRSANGVILELACIFCRNCLEDRNHLFFGCPHLLKEFGRVL